MRAHNWLLLASTHGGWGAPSFGCVRMRLEFRAEKVVEVALNSESPR